MRTTYNEDLQMMRRQLEQMRQERDEAWRWARAWKRAAKTYKRYNMELGAEMVEFTERLRAVVDD